MTLQFSSIETELAARHATTGQPIGQESGTYRLYGKRVLDVVLTCLAAPVILPLVAIMAFLIAMDGHNPFYSQLRVGRNGRHFRMWKLRTMVHNADALLEAHLNANAAARLEWTATQKLKNDPRVTWVGRLLRKTSMDELPQLWNVLTGDMSLVGPRPMMVSQRSSYAGTSYFHMRPGITGLWQVSDRNECLFSDRVYFDDTYWRTMSLWTDLTLLIKTVFVVVRGTGY